MAHEKWIKSLEEGQVPQNYNPILEDTFGLEHVEDVDIQIFCDGDVNKEENKLGIGCITFDRQNTILAKNLKMYFW